MDSNKRCHHEMFKSELKSFMKNLIKVFPEDRDVKMMSSTLNIAMMDDEEEMISKFYNVMAPYSTMISSKDDAFFMKVSSDVDIPLFGKLNHYWQGLDVDNKKIVWDYIQVLYTLAAKLFV